jgi:hypothetical protein
LSGLVVAQISLSLVLLVCAGLFTRSLQKAQQSDPEFEASHLLLASYELSPAGYTRATGVAFNRQVLDRLSALPGVESVTLADFSPLSNVNPLSVTMQLGTLFLSEPTKTIWQTVVDFSELAMKARALT